MLTVITLAPLIVSDFRRRSVSAYWLIAFGVAQLINGSFSEIGVNLLLLLFLLLGSWIYFHLRYKMSLTNVLGMGDILFLLFLTPCFEFSDFLSFLILGFLFSLVWWLFDQTHTIPLVTTFGLLLLIHCL